MDIFLYGSHNTCNSIATARELSSLDHSFAKSCGLGIIIGSSVGTHQEQFTPFAGS